MKKKKRENGRNIHKKGRICSCDVVQCDIMREAGFRAAVREFRSGKLDFPFWKHEVWESDRVRICLNGISWFPFGFSRVGHFSQPFGLHVFICSTNNSGVVSDGWLGKNMKE